MKILNANCQDSIVKTSDGVTMPECPILSNGIGESNGYALISEDQFFYIAKTVDDLKTIIDKVVSALDELTNASNLLNLDNQTLLGYSATPITGSAPLNSEIVNSLNTIKSDLTTLKDNLK